MDSTLRRTWAEIDMDALAHNYETLRKELEKMLSFRRCKSGCLRTWFCTGKQTFTGVRSRLSCSKQYR